MLINPGLAIDLGKGQYLGRFFFERRLRKSCNDHEGVNIAWRESLQFRVSDQSWAFATRPGEGEPQANGGETGEAKNTGNFIPANCICNFMS